MKILGNKTHIINPAQPFLTINAYVKPIEIERKSAIATKMEMPQMICFLFFDSPLLNCQSTTKPSIVIANAPFIYRIAIL